MDRHAPLLRASCGGAGHGDAARVSLSGTVGRKMLLLDRGSGVGYLGDNIEAMLNHVGLRLCVAGALTLSGVKRSGLRSRGRSR